MRLVLISWRPAVAAAGRFFFARNSGRRPSADKIRVPLHEPPTNGGNLLLTAPDAKPDDAWVMPDLVLPIVVAVLVSFLIPAFVAWVGALSKNRADARQLRMELVRDFIKSLSEYEAAFALDSMENSKASEEAFEAGARRFVGFNFKQVPAKANVRSCWRSILAQTQNLDTQATERATQLALFTRALKFLDVPKRELNPKDIEHFPDVLGPWIKKGHMDFDRLTANLDAIASESDS